MPHENILTFCFVCLEFPPNACKNFDMQMWPILQVHVEVDGERETEAHCLFVFIYFPS